MKSSSLSRRTFIRNSALALGAAPFWKATASLVNPPKRKILFFSKSSGFEHSVISYAKGQPSLVEKTLNEIGPKNNWDLTFSKDGSLFSPTYLAQFDAFFFYTTGDLCSPGTDKQPPMTLAGKQALLDAVANGKGFIGSHSAADTFHTNNEAKKGPDRYKNFGAAADPYVRMLGGEFIKHDDQQKAHIRCVDTKFPGMENCGTGFDKKEEWYSLKDFSDNLHVLLVQETETMKGNEYQRPPYPETWARMHNKGRVFYTSMGHRDEVWSDALFREIFCGGMHWVCGNVNADVTPNLNQVAPGWAQNPPFPTNTKPAAATPEPPK
ncbi:MAG TPA: ThuA domain-containing protein [Chthoniobacteraceae bacterium]|jgi:hypothetical protein